MSANEDRSAAGDETPITQNGGPLLYLAPEDYPDVSHLITEDGAPVDSIYVDLQYRLLVLFDAMLYSAEFPEGFRSALALRGIRPGSGRQPKSPSQELQLGKLSEQLQCLLAAEGFASEPIGGCPAGQNVDPDQIARIVQNVVGELKKRGY